MSDPSAFDESSVDWQQLPGIDHAWLWILSVDDTAKIVDILFKFSANEKIVLHRHVAAFNTFVIRGEHRIYNPDGELTEIRPVGTYKASPAGVEPHREGGGDEDVLVHFSLRPYENGPVYEVLDENHQLVSTMTFDDLKEMYESAH
jgi:hypothetical protein